MISTGRSTYTSGASKSYRSTDTFPTVGPSCRWRTGLREAFWKPSLALAAVVPPPPPLPLLNLKQLLNQRETSLFPLLEPQYPTSCRL